MAHTRRGDALPVKAPRRAPTRQATTAILSSPGLLPNGFVAAHGRTALADRRKGGPYSARAELFQGHGRRRGGLRTRVEVSLEPACRDLHVAAVGSFIAREERETRVQQAQFQVLAQEKRLWRAEQRRVGGFPLLCSVRHSWPAGRA